MIDPISLMRTSKEIHLDISIVIVSWNVSDLLRNCIQSINKYAHDLVFEIIVVDNYSSDDSVSMVKKEFPEVRIICNDFNAGFALANNQAFEISRGKYILILNPDTRVLECSIQKLVNILNTYDDVGMVGPRLIYPDGEIQLECARLLPSLYYKLFHDVIKVQKIPLIGKWLTEKYFSPYSYEISHNVEAISGAAMLVRKKLISQLKGFGEKFLFAGEDVDLCFRTQKAGWNIYYEHESVIVHLFGQSRKTNPCDSTINGEISQQEYYLRNYGKFQALLFRLIIVILEIPIIIFTGIIKYLLHKESIKELRTRLSIARGLIIWNPKK